MFISVIMSILLMFSPVHSPDTISITMDSKTIAEMNPKDLCYPYIDLPIMNEENYGKFLDQLDKKVLRRPVNAHLDKHGNIVPEQVGSKINRDALTEQIYAAYFNQRPSRLELPMSSVYPTVDSELLSEIRTMRIGRYVTSFNSTNKNRSTNIKIATEAINNYVVFPGEIFSFNKVVGKRTKARGYLRAKVIVRGEYDEDIGGGICQVSSTLFNAVDNAGLQIVERFSHSKSVPYIPPGRDATVSWYGPDFEFKNQYNQPVLIRASTLGNMLIIKVYSSESINYKAKKIPSLPY
jgi:vancomycin resistance protein YoaR